MCQFSWQDFLQQDSLCSLHVHRVRKERAAPSLALCAELPSIPAVADVVVVEVADTARLAASSQQVSWGMPGSRGDPTGQDSTVPKAVCMCAYTIYVSALLPLFLLLAQGPCSSRPWDLPGLRLSNAFKVSRRLPAPGCPGARCAVCESSCHHTVLRAGDWNHSV